MPTLIVITCLSLITICISTPLVFKFEQLQNQERGIDENSWFEIKDSIPVKNEDSNKENTCGYKSCNLGKPDMLNVHIVPHTHDDVGWLKTVDQYYYGARNDIQNAGVQYILDTVIQALKDNPDRKFIYVEIAFFSRWWNEQNDDMKSTVKDLVNSGRLQFILGGWCMNDEAATHYNAMIDQHTLGFKFLKDNFGDCATPRIGWQIDPFGHSREQASMFAQFGFDGLFFGRLDYQDKDARMKNKTAEMMWMASDSLGDQSSLFTGVNYNGYGPPGGFCFDEGCRDTPVMDDPKLEDYNVDDIVTKFIKACKDQALNYTTNNIMMTMGSDFQFQNAHQNFKNLDKLIKYVNMKQSNGSKVNLIYSTPACYLYAVNQANKTYTSKNDDFFPYASREHTFWTGYFTSRPALKRYVRESNNFLQVCKQMESLSGLHMHPEKKTSEKVNVLREAMGVAQHHDAVSGTEKQHVADDYAKRLAHGIAECQDVMNMGYDAMLPLGSDSAPDQEYCPWANISVCNATTKNVDFTITIYNPLARPVTHWVRLPVDGYGYSVMDPNMKKLEAYAITNQPFTWKLAPQFNATASRNQLTFKAELAPLGFSTFFAQKIGSIDVETALRNMGNVKHHMIDPPIKDFSIQNEHIKLTYSKEDGLLKSITNLDKNITTMVHHELMYYKAFNGNNSKGEFQASGAYVFRPNGTDPEKITQRVDVVELESRIMHEIRTDYSDWGNTVHRLYKGEKFVEVEWSVGPIPFNDSIGKEVISRFVTDLSTDKTFYTDSNGREHLKRVINYRPTWNLNQTEPVAGNYYPVNSRIVLFDEKKDIQLTVVTDRSHGGASVEDGEMELMLHRRMFVDDSFGVGEALNETGFNGKGLIVRGWHRLFLDTGEASGHLHRDMEERMYMGPSISVSKLTMKPEDYAKKFRTQWSGLTKALPPNVHLLTLEAWSEDTYILRLEHYYEKDQDKNMSMDATVSLKGMFTAVDIESVEELTLGANQMLKDATRLTWNVQNMGKTTSDMKSFVKPVDPSTLMVELKPMQIRTFQLKVKPKKSF